MLRRPPLDVPRFSVKFTPQQKLPVKEEIRKLFPHTSDAALLKGEMRKQEAPSKLKIGALFSGGPAPGGHNVLAGIFDTGCHLFGFLEGPQGLIEGKQMEISSQQIDRYRNTGGFDLLGTGRTKIETEDQLAKALKAVQDFDGIVIIGGDDSNTNAAVIAEYFAAHRCKTKVIGVPKTIDGDLQNPYVEVPFGFDTATKVYSELIGNIARDVLSTKKYTHFIKLMGRSASHVTLQCSLMTHPNLTLISEEGLTFEQIVLHIADLIEKRAAAKKTYGVVLIPEGLIENMELPDNVKRDPHGNIHLSSIATETMIIEGVQKELQRRNFRGKFDPQAHFFGYEGRCAFPSNFDANYCYALGQTAAHLIAQGFSSYMAFVQNLKKTPAHWGVGGVPLTSQMALFERSGKQKPVIQKTFVDLKGKPYLKLKQCEAKWQIEDDYQFPGPTQFDEAPLSPL